MRMTLYSAALCVLALAACTGAGKTDSTETARPSDAPAPKVRYDADRGAIVSVANPEHVYRIINIPAGHTAIGATPCQSRYAEKDEIPAHRVDVAEFGLGETEVPQWLWVDVMGHNPSQWQRDNLPVERVSLVACRKFIDELNRQTGQTFRLPTEAEWEYAARGGNSDAYLYAGSNNINEVAWQKKSGVSGTQPVGQLKPNRFGLYDMSGNVWEWCSDPYLWYDGTRDRRNRDGYVRRGGGWKSETKDCRVSLRNNSDSTYSKNTLGLRLAR